MFYWQKTRKNLRDEFFCCHRFFARATLAELPKVYAGDLVQRFYRAPNARLQKGIQMKNVFIFIGVLAVHIFGFALQGVPPVHQKYYGSEFYGLLSSVKDSQLKDVIKKVLRSSHLKSETGADQIVDNCEGKKGCYRQTSLGYDGARTFLFGKFYLVKLDAANYGITEMYCNRIYDTNDFKGTTPPGPGITPSANVINTEHTWPQSRFSGNYSSQLQKADLHHLFPTDSGMNSKRGNTIFGEVTQDKGATNCSASRYGTGSAGGREIFEPADAHKGRVARAIFYFSVRYDMPISTEEEVVLKKWNHEHPVEEQEALRNDEIFKQQNNRNPFVDYPELADQIADF